MTTKKKIGRIIIGVVITLVIALIPLIIYGEDPIAGNRLRYNAYLKGVSLFQYLLAIGLSCVIILNLIGSKRIVKGIIYPILICLIIAILLGVIFPIYCGGNNFCFNKKVFWIFSVAGLFISAIDLAIYLMKE